MPQGARPRAAPDQFVRTVSQPYTPTPPSVRAVRQALVSPGSIPVAGMSKWSNRSASPSFSLIPPATVWGGSMVQTGPGRVSPPVPADLAAVWNERFNGRPPSSGAMCDQVLRVGDHDLRGDRVGLLSALRLYSAALARVGQGRGCDVPFGR